MKKPTASQVRTAKILEYFNNLPGEWEMLKGLLCCNHPFNYQNAKPFHRLFDFNMIACRMDAITSAARQQLRPGEHPGYTIVNRYGAYSCEGGGYTSQYKPTANEAYEEWAKLSGETEAQRNVRHAQWAAATGT